MKKILLFFLLAAFNNFLFTASAESLLPVDENARKADLLNRYFLMQVRAHPHDTANEQYDVYLKVSKDLWCPCFSACNKEWVENFCAFFFRCPKAHFRGRARVEDGKAVLQYEDVYLYNCCCSNDLTKKDVVEIVSGIITEKKFIGFNGV